MAALDVSSEDDASPSARAWRWYASMGSPKRVLAPMVGQSELAFRQLVRRYGCDLAVTPMVHARMFATCDRYRADVLRDLGDAEDRPLLVQFCGDDKDYLLEAAAAACAPFCDGVDLNLGCPQGIARRGHYGAFLLEEPDLVCGIVEHLSTRLPVPGHGQDPPPEPDGRGADDRAREAARRRGGLAFAKGHLHKLLFEKLQVPGREALRERVSQGEAWADFQAVVDELRRDDKGGARDRDRSWYRRHRAAKARADEKARRDAEEAARQEALDDAADDGGGLGGLFGDEDE
ncbi:hypothetical protein JL722_4230 [Aureococcus anophagefferens]|nr:hypothetical protein JL722_4230 [Aureococcus anophagefferens]